MWKEVTSHNTHKTIADKFQPTPDSSNHPCHLHMTSEIPRTKFLCSNLVVINFQPWTLPIVKSHLLLLSDPGSLCSLFMYTFPFCVFLHTSVPPTLAHPTLPTSPINAMFTDPIYK